MESLLSASPPRRILLFLAYEGLISPWSLEELHFRQLSIIRRLDRVETIAELTLDN